MRYCCYLVLLLLCFVINSASAIQRLNTPWHKNFVYFGTYQKNFLSPDLPKPPSPLFWSAGFKVDSAYYLRYQHLFFHTKNHFSFSFGASVATLVYKNESEYAFSAFADMQFWLWHNYWVNPYLDYAIAGPTMLTNKTFGKSDFPESFVFQDMLGLGAMIPFKYPLDFGFDMVHYSNGDIFYKNSGIDIPFVMWIGMRF